MAELEHIRNILKRVFQQLEKDWEQQGEEEQIEGKDEKRNTTADQV